MLGGQLGVVGRVTTLLVPPRTGLSLRHAATLGWVAGAGAVLAQIVFPLADGALALTLGSVALFALASVSHAVARFGPWRAAGLVTVAGGGGLLAELVGVATGFPFGHYAYSGTLGWAIEGVPAVVPAAWTMMAYPALLVGRRLAGSVGRPAVVVVAAWALASWDVFLDPQMVDAGHWRWTSPTPSLPGVSGIPLSNFAGWLLVALVMTALLDRVLRGDGPDPRAGGGTAGGHAGDDRLPVALYLWTYASSVLAHTVFFGRPSVALVGGVAMGLVAVPLAVDLRRHGFSGAPAAVDAAAVDTAGTDG